MRLRRTQWAASLLGVWFSVSVAVSQEPPSANHELFEPAPKPTAGGEELYFFQDELDFSSRLRFQADWLSFTRNNQAKDTQFFTGPDSASQRDIDFHYQSGYRLNLGYMNDDYELEGTFFELDGLNGTRRGTLSRALVFDGRTASSPGRIGYEDADFDAQFAIDPDLTPNFLSARTYFAAIHAAANNEDLVTTANSEIEELETLGPGARFVARYASDVQDIEVNLKGRRQPGRLLRFGVGFRNVRLNESGFVQLRGEFDTFDTDGDDSAGNNGPNDGLSEGALTGAGLDSNGAADGFLENVAPISPDTLLFTTNTRATNLLNGVQATLDATLLESEYFELGGFVRAGVFHNEVQGSVSESYRDFTGAGSIYSRSFRDSKDRVAFVGNLGVTGRISLRDNVRLFSSYEVMFLSGVALAPDQMDGLRTNLAGATSLDLRTDGSVILHGGRIGVELLWP